MSAPIFALDMFCGAGGATTGLQQACAAADRDLSMIAVNHWQRAVETHAANHPWADHLCASVDSLSPRKVVGRRRVDLLMAGPECTHHSTARGGLPINDQSRASAWHVVHWAEALRPRVVLVENVQEFATWGPLGANGRPLKRRKGETFAAWCAALRSLGYRLEVRTLCSADYGDPTTRRRLFIAAVRGRSPIHWPAPSHARSGAPDLFGSRQPWRTAREIIDWEHRGASIFSRKKPLAPNTLRRIEEGLRRFGGEHAAPFLALLTHGGRIRSIDDPVPTVTSANRGELALIEPFLLGQQSRSAPRRVSEPTPTLAAKGAVSLVEPYLVLYQGNRTADMRRSQEIDYPLGTLDTSNRYGLAEPFLVRYHGTGTSESVRVPVPTVTTRDRFGLVEPTVPYDILFRMLQPRELARAQGFPDSYTFAGNRGETVRQIGNAWSVGLARALTGSLLGVA